MEASLILMLLIETVAETVVDIKGRGGQATEWIVRSLIKSLSHPLCMLYIRIFEHISRMSLLLCTADCPSTFLSEFHMRFVSIEDGSP